MIKIRKIPAALLVGILLIVCASTVAIVSMRNQRRAANCLAAISRLEVNRSTFQDVLLLKGQLRGKVRSTGATECSEQRCTVEFWYDNSALATFHLAPFSFFSASVRVESGRVASVDTAHFSRFTKQRTGIPFLQMRISEQLPNEWNPAGVKVSQKRDTEGTPWEAQIYVTPNVDQSLKKQLRSFNLSCLSTLGGCTSLQQISSAGYEYLK